MNRRLAVLSLMAGAIGVAFGSAATAADYVVEISKMAFGPVPAGLHVGDTITWRNSDIFRHTATARDKSFDVDLKPKAESQIVLKTAGEIAFFCRFHPGMTGALSVAP